MTPHLPPELWTHIALYLENDSSSLTNCARVCHQWQPVFERLLYRNIRLLSEGFQPGKGFVSLSQFRGLVSGSNQYRRSFIRRLEYIVITPHKLHDYRAVKLQGYRDQNPVRDANNQAFWTGMKSLFEFLSSWEEGPKFALVPAAHGRDVTLEPETEAKELAYSWEVELDGERVVGPYRARFPDDVPMLPQVTCINDLSIKWGYDYIWVGTALQIAESCLGLQRFDLDMDDTVRPDHLWYMQERRQAVASGLLRLQSTLRVLKCMGSFEHPWSNTLPALDLRPANSKIDELSSSLRLLSCNLKELYLSGMSFDMDFLLPLDDSGSPTTDASSLHWPYLESIVLAGVPGHLPSGEWLFDYELDTGDEEDFPDPATGDEIFESRWLREGYQISRHKMNTEYFHRLFISLGYAARCMPLLRTILFAFYSRPTTVFKFNRDRCSTSFGAKPCLKFESATGYTPDRRIAAAWGFSLDDLVVDNPWPDKAPEYVCSSVTLDRLPNE
ncbi:hypothetical protein BJX63DRAFT_133120 [Aspergillus granulosus]|uniref:F-box domain-containing protein n=1 Tax=Aspergillus granulosus TaxID=176169 RepID=A0ABR4GTD7_9EURO